MNLNDKKNMIILVDAWKVFAQIQSDFMIKSLRECRDKWNIPQQNKSYIWEAHNQHHAKWGGAWSNPTEIGNETGMCSIQGCVLKMLAGAMSQGKGLKEIRIRKEEVQPSLFADDVLYTRNPKTSTGKLPAVINSVTWQGTESSCTNQ